MSNLSLKARDSLWMALCAVLWSSAGLFIKWLPGWSSMQISGGRAVFATVILWFYIRRKGYHFVFDRYSVGASLGLAGCTILFCCANKLTTAANAIVLQYLSPVFILIFSAVFLKKKMRSGDVFVVIACMVGIGMCFLDQLSLEGLLGNVLAILSGVCMSVMYIILGLGHVDNNQRFTSIFLGLSIAMVVGLAFSPMSPFDPRPVDFLIITFLGIFQLGLPYICFGLASRNCPPLACSLIGLLEPLLNPTWVFIGIGEAPGVIALLGGAVVLISLFFWFIWDSRHALPPHMVPEDPEHGL